MKEEKNFIFNISLGILIPLLITGVWTTFIRPFIAYKENESSLSSKKDLLNSKASIKKTSDEFFKSKLDLAIENGTSFIDVKDGPINWSAEIIYDDFLKKYHCNIIPKPNPIDYFPTINPITKDITLNTGRCFDRENCPNKDDLDNTIKYRLDDGDIKNYYKPTRKTRFGWDRLYIDYFSILPYEIFKDAEKIQLRYKRNFFDSYKTTEFSTNSVLKVTRLSRLCGFIK